MIASRYSIGVNRAYTPTSANETFLALGATQAASTETISVIRLLAVQFYQGNTNAKSLTVNLMTNTLIWSASPTETLIGSGNSYEQLNPISEVAVLQGSSPTAPIGELGRCQLGPNVGDMSRLVWQNGYLLYFGYPKPLAPLNVLDLIGIRVAETTALDINVTFTFDLLKRSPL